MTTTTKKYLEQSCFYFVTIPYNILRLSINGRRKNERNIQWHKSWHWIWTLSLWAMSLVLYQWATPRRWKNCYQRTIVNVTLGYWLCTSTHLKKAYCMTKIFENLQPSNIRTVKGIFWYLELKEIEDSINFWNLNFAD